MRLVLALLLGTVLAGCSKRDSAPPQAEASAVDQGQVAPGEAPTTVQSPSAPVPLAPSGTPRTAPQPVAQPASDTVALEGAVHAFMTIQLHKFIQENGRMPKDFSEFSSSKVDSVPFAPPGMQFVIDYTTKQVKVVKVKK